MVLLDGCWLSAWGTVARSGSWQIDCSTTAITDQERKEQHTEQFSNSFGSSVVAATVARGTHASGYYPFATSSSKDSQDASHVADELDRNSEWQIAGFEVLLRDPVADRRDAIIATIAEAGGTARVIETSLLEHVGDLPPACRIALVALGESLNRAAPVLGLIGTLGKSGFEVIAYEDNAEHWPVGTKCLPLLAGAAQVLDSSGVQFTTVLQRLVVGAVQAHAGRRTADDTVQSVMQQHGVMGNSAAMMAVFRKAIGYSSLSDLPVLITGETGTGKELLARAIHQLDPKRNQGPFVAVNCAAINPGLMESDLFGHRRGAFTGAERNRKGLIRAAEGGVLFLDEVGELDWGLQAKLLRVLQENSVLSVGEERELPVSVRFIAATNRDLAGMVAEGTFRLDLFHRLRVLPIRIPPLRERSYDLVPLVAHFVCKHRSPKGAAPRGVSGDFTQALAQLKATKRRPPVSSASLRAAFTTNWRSTTFTADPKRANRKLQAAPEQTSAPLRLI